MRVVLRADVDGVGRRGDIVEVTGGFARNFLLPHGRGIVATKGIEAQAAAMRKRRDLREAQDRDSARTQAEVLTGAVIRIEARTGKAGRLFGSVSAADIATAVQDQKGVEIDRHRIALAEPIKVVGTYDVTAGLFEDVSALLTVEVVAAG
jgi:large subunit ribosomal protein L9